MDEKVLGYAFPWRRLRCPSPSVRFSPQRHTHTHWSWTDFPGYSGGHIAGVRASTSRPTAARARPAPAMAGSRTVSSASQQANSAQVAAMQARVAEIEAHSEGLLKERDFYFDSEVFVPSK